MGEPSEQLLSERVTMTDTEADLATLEDMQRNMAQFAAFLDTFNVDSGGDDEV